MSRIFIWLESSSTLNFVSELDPDEMVQTHMLSWVFPDHICHNVPAGSLQVHMVISCSGPSCDQEKSTCIGW